MTRIVSGVSACSVPSKKRTRAVDFPTVRIVSPFSSAVPGYAVIQSHVPAFFTLTVPVSSRKWALRRSDGGVLPATPPSSGSIMAL